MDAPGHSLDVIADNLNDLRRVNRLLGGVRLTLHPLRRLLAHLSAAEQALVLDVASGGADIPQAVARWSATRGRSWLVVASDVSLDYLRVARAHPAHHPAVRYVVADATCLPFKTGAFHAVTSSLALHHMLPDEARRLLAEAGRCTRVGVVVNDIVRGWLGYGGAYVATRLGSRNTLTWHDGPLSVLRAYTPDEMREISRETGLRPVEWHSFLFYRVAMTAVPQRDGAVAAGRGG